MSNKKKDWLEHLGSPDIKIAGLSIWVHQRQFPDAEDYWDGNWVVVTVCCKANYAEVWTTGPIIHLPEVEKFMRKSQQLYDSLSGEAEIDCMEPELNVMLKMHRSGQLRMRVELTPNHMKQGHWFEFDIDQSYLPGLIRDCRAVLETYPVKNGDANYDSQPYAKAYDTAYCRPFGD